VASAAGSFEPPPEDPPHAARLTASTAVIRIAIAFFFIKIILLFLKMKPPVTLPASLCDVMASVYKNTGGL
jgi:hypothetical protein